MQDDSPAMRRTVYHQWWALRDRVCKTKAPALLTMGKNEEHAQSDSMVAATLAWKGGIRGGKFAYTFTYFDSNWTHDRSSLGDQEAYDQTSQCGILVAVKLLQDARAREADKYPGINVDIVVMHSTPLSEFFVDRLKEMNVHIAHVPHAATKGTGDRYGDSFGKLSSARLFQYHRVIFLEIDYVLLRSLDYLFLGSSNILAPYAAPWFYWGRPHDGSTQAGPFVADPTPHFWDTYFAGVMDRDAGGKYPGETMNL